MPSPDPSIDAALRKAPLTGCPLREERHADPYVEARRALEICNACRYCEGFCAVFPAMTRRREFADADLNYLANLCHSCRACFYSCQYAPPHEFGINVPKVFAEVRLRSYERYCWPKPLGKLFRRNGAVVATATAVGTIVALLLALGLIDHEILFQPARHPGAFYAIVPYWLMMSLAGAAAVFALTSVTIGVVAFWKDIAGQERQVHARPLGVAAYDVLSLRNLDGGRGVMIATRVTRTRVATSTTRCSTASHSVLPQPAWLPCTTTCSVGERRMNSGAFPCSSASGAASVSSSARPASQG
jgi:CitB-like protein